MADKPEKDKPIQVNPLPSLPPVVPTERNFLASTIHGSPPQPGYIWSDYLQDWIPPTGLPSSGIPPFVPDQLVTIPKQYYCGSGGRQGEQAFGFPDISKVRVDLNGNVTGLPPGVDRQWLIDNTNVFSLRPGDTGCFRSSATPPKIEEETPQEKKCCTEGELCDGLNKSLEAIADTLKAMGEILAGKYNDGDCASAKCREEIEKIVTEKIEEERKRFDDCKKKAEAGLCGTFEFEQQCGKLALDLCKE